MYKVLREEGMLESIPVRMRHATPKEKGRYTLGNCSFKATVMRTKPVKDSRPPPTAAPPSNTNENEDIATTSPNAQQGAMEDEANLSADPVTSGVSTGGQ